MADYKSGALEAAFDTQCRILAVLHRLPPDVAVAIVHTAVNQRPMQMTRQLPPDVMSRHLHRFDTLTDDCLARVLGRGDGGLPQHAKVLRGLPTYMAGLGIPRLRTISTSAHTACMTQAIVATEQLSALLSTRVRSFCDGLTPDQVRWFTDNLPICKVTTQHAAGGGEEVRFKPPFRGDGGAIGLAAAAPLGVDHDHPRLQDRVGHALYSQQALTQVAYAKAHADLLGVLMDEGCWPRAAMVRSTEPLRPLHSWILSALSTGQHLRMTRADYVDAVRHRLLIPSFDGVDGSCRYCACRQLRIDQEEHQLHLMSCTASAKVRQRTHDLLVDAVVAFASRAVGAAGVTKEQTLEHPARPVIRMDVVVTKPDGQQLMIDVGHTAPAGRLAVPTVDGDHTGSAFVRCRAAAAYEVHKRERAARSLPADAVGRFHPMVFETTGALGDAGRGVLRALSGTDVLPAVCDGVVARARRNFLRHAGTILARGAARCAQAVRASSTAAQFSAEDWAALGELDIAAYGNLPEHNDDEREQAAPVAGPLAEPDDGDDR